MTERKRHSEDNASSAAGNQPPTIPNKKRNTTKDTDFQTLSSQFDDNASSMLDLVSKWHIMLPSMTNYILKTIQYFFCRNRNPFVSFRRRPYGGKCKSISVTLLGLKSVPMT